MSTAVTVNGVGSAVSTTWDPPKPVESGREVTQPEASAGKVLTKEK